MKTITLATPEVRQNACNSTNELLAQAQAILSLAELRPGDALQHTFKTSLSAASDLIGGAHASLVSMHFDGVFNPESIGVATDRLCKAKAIISLLTDAEALEDDAAELVCTAAINFLGQAMDSMDMGLE